MTTRISSDPKTLGFLLGTTPAKRSRSLESVSMLSVTQGLKAYEAKAGGNPYAQDDAVRFYLSSHLLADISQTFPASRPLNDEQYALIKQLLGYVTETSARFYFYALKIVLREYRHCKNRQHMLEVFEKYCQKSAAYLDYVMDSSSDVLFENMEQCQIDAPFGNVLRCVEYGFYHAKWSAGYGGPKWGVIARVLRRFIEGQYSPEIMLDIGWALAHNGGPIFNKGYFYAGFSGGTLLKVLDLQRAGEIPAGVRAGEIPIPCALLIPGVEKHFGLQYPERVDWWKVDKLGAKNSWSTQLHKQMQWEKMKGLPPSPWQAKKKAHVQDIMQLEISNTTEISLLFAQAAQQAAATLIAWPPHASSGPKVAVAQHGSGKVISTHIRQGA